jgi:polyphosphate glucokinase
MTTVTNLNIANGEPAAIKELSACTAVTKVLVADIGGKHIKLLVTGQSQPRKVVSGPLLTPELMMAGIREAVSDWDHDVVSIGYPGPVLSGRPLREPHNLGTGWVQFDFETAFGRPVKIINDAAMQAIGSYRSGRMLFLGLGTGLGTTLIIEGVVHPMELGHLPYKKSTFEDYVGQRGLNRNGKKQWRDDVEDVVARLIAALQPSDVVLGGGNVKKLKELPPNTRLGDNANAFDGGFRLWDM